MSHEAITGKRERRYVVVGLANDPSLPIQNGVRFLKVDGIEGAAMSRWLSDRELQEVFMEFGPFLQLVEDSRPITRGEAKPVLQLMR